MGSERIKLEDTGMGILVKMSEGNPGALRVCMDILRQGKAIDPANALGGMGHILALDTYGIYGHRIWMFYKDVCGEDLVKMLGVIRGIQLGFVGPKEVNRAIDGANLDIDAILSKVRERLPNFVKTA